MTRGIDIKRWGLQALAHGAKMILYQGYREWNCIPIHWGALVDFDGAPTERYTAAGALGRLFAENTDFIARAQPVPSRVALLYDHTNVLVSASMGGDDFMRTALRGLHEALWRAGYGVDFVTPEHLAHADYDVLFLPFAMAVSESAGQALAAFVEGGGRLVGFAKCAMLDGRGWSWNQRPGAGLEAVFGVRESWITVDEAPRFTLAIDGRDFALAGHHHRQDLTLVGGATAIGAWPDGAPAVVRHDFGAGRAYYFGTHADIAAKDSRAYPDAFAALLAGEGVTPACRVTGSGDLQLIDAHLLRSGADNLLIVCNEARERAEVDIHLPGIAAARGQDLMGGGVLVAPAGDGPRVSLALDARDATAIRLMP